MTTTHEPGNFTLSAPDLQKVVPRDCRRIRPVDTRIVLPRSRNPPDDAQVCTCVVKTCVVMRFANASSILRSHWSFSCSVKAMTGQVPICPCTSAPVASYSPCIFQIATACEQFPVAARSGSSASLVFEMLNLILPETSGSQHLVAFLSLLLAEMVALQG
jgi:hypothetical protein